MSSAVILESQDLPARTTTDIGLMSVGANVGHSHLFPNKKTSLGVYVSYINLTPYYALAKQRYDYGTAPQGESGSMIFRQKTSKTGMLKAFVNYDLGRLALTYPYSVDTSAGNFSFRNKNHNLFAQASYKELLAKHWTLFADASYSYDHNDILLDNRDSIVTQTKEAQGRITISRPVGNLSSIRFGAEAQHPVYEDVFDSYKSNATDNYTAEYAEGDIYLSKKLVARLGARTEYSSLLGKADLAPRVSLAYKTGELSQVSFATGQFYQEPDRAFLYATDPLTFEHADHYILNYQSVSSKRTFRVEAYYKAIPQPYSHRA